jgi:PBP1b-binding outer membrane lipoprotein LpoB
MDTKPKGPIEFFDAWAQGRVIGLVAGALVALVIITAVLVASCIADAQTPPPAQAQAPAQAAPAQPSDPMLDQADADLRALVASINARLSAINDDMTAMKERAKRQAPVAKPAEAKPAK